jgi:hypothetical protein
VALSATSVNEDGTVTLTGTYSDVGSEDTHTLTINWGEADPQTVVVTGGTFTVTHQYKDDNPTNTASDVYTIGVTLTDDDTGTDEASTTTTISNVAPEILTITATSVNENGTVTLTGTYSDVGSLDTHTLTINWGEGDPQTVVVTGGTFTVMHQYKDDNPSNTASDEYTIGVTLTDDDTGTDVASTTTTITNVAPQVLTLSATSVNENGIVTLTGTYSDVGSQDTHKITINWGEGAPQTVVVTGGTFSVEHQYLDDNPTNTGSDIYTIDVTLTDDDTGTDVASTTMTITNVDPVLAVPGNTSSCCGDAAENEVVTINATFTDVGTLDTHSATIDWGDGSSSLATISQSAGGGSLSGSHAYATGGIFTVTVTLTDDDGGTTAQTTTVVISGVGVVGDTLYVIGTDGDDHVTINQADSVYKVHADFLTTGNFRNVPTAGITRIVVQTCEGDDHVTVSGGINLPTQIDGGEGDDTLNGGNGPNIIVGGPGDDRINGGSGRDILIGGVGADRLVGNSADDLMISGATAYDSNDVALTAIMSEWNSSRNYSQRVHNLSNGTGGSGLDASTFGSRANGGHFLIGNDGATQTVFNDNEEDKLTGSSANDWFFANLVADNGGVIDKITDKASGEIGTDTDY